MFCRKCGKEILDDSEFCYSCGSKVEIKEKDVVTDTTPPNVNITKSPELQNTNQETNDEKSSQPVSSNLTKTKEKSNGLLKNGYGWVILLSFYGYGLTSYFKNHPYPVTILSMIILFSSLILLLLIYFRYRSHLIKKNFWKGDIKSSSFLSGVISYFLVGSLVIGSISYISGHEKRKEMEKFMNDYKGKIEMITKKEIEYQKIMGSQTTTESEVKDKILKVDEYKGFRVKKHQVFIELINFFRKINLEYKNDKSIDEKITQLENVYTDIHKTSMESLEFYKKYLIIGDEQYLILHQQGVEKLQTVGKEVTPLSTDIYKSL